MRSLSAALLLLASAFAGCLDGSFVERIRNDLEAEDAYEDRTLVLERVPFTPAGIVDPSKTIEDESDVSSQWNRSFDVPEDTRRVTVTFDIELSTPDPSGALPDEGPKGEVRAYVQTADGEERNLTRSEPATAGFDFPSPTAGGWTVGMEARGNGTVTFDVHALAPVDAAPR